jgi:hypothetical protein
VCRAPGNAAILLQQANGDFGPARNTPVEETPIGIAVVNSNCDDKDDLLVANLAGSSVVVLESNGDGNFTTVQTLGVAQVGTNPIAVAVADFNQDGVDDFAVANTVAPLGSSNVHLFKGQCTGPFAAFGGTGIRIGELANSLVARDFTGDQIVDLAVISQTSNQVCLLVGVGDGRMTRVGFGSCDEVSRMPIAIAAGDFDADGRYDAVSANNDPSANNVSVLSNCIRDEGCDLLTRGELLAEDVDRRRPARRLEAADRRQRVGERRPRDVAARERPHDRFRHDRDGLDEDAVEERAGHHQYEMLHTAISETGSSVWLATPCSTTPGKMTVFPASTV